MSKNYRRRSRKSERRVWVFSELNADLSPKDIARILAGAALEAAEAAKAAVDSGEEGRHE